MRVKPAPGRQVRDPITKRHIPEKGKDVPPTAYWIRRLKAGDVLEVKVLASADDVSTPASTAPVTKDEE